MGFLLFIISLIALPVGLIFQALTLLKYLLNGQLKEINIWFYDMAISMDQFYNVSGRGFLNTMFRKPEGYDFGKVDETISSALGKNERAHTLTFFGKVLNACLSWLDPDHAKKSIEEDE